MREKKSYVFFVHYISVWTYLQRESSVTDISLHEGAGLTQGDKDEITSA